MANKQSIITPKAVIAAIASVLALFLSFVALQAYIDSRIQQQIEDPAFLQKLGGELRPSVIFDSNGSILADQGAMHYIEDINVKRHDEIKFAAKSITISPKSFLAQAPLLTSIDQNNYIITSHRGKKYDWIYSTDLLAWSSDTTSRFRLEIIH